ncbi:MAG: hypothetical protein IJ309_04310 [Clostridia bacterium]|nr:hypothetical protein [Clostridia bacterium]
MIIEKKEEIKELLIRLENQIRNGDENACINDTNLHSLFLWSKYQEYLYNILSLFNPKEKEEYEKLAGVITCLKLDEFCVCAKKKINESKNELESYISSIKEKLN